MPRGRTRRMTKKSVKDDVKQLKKAVNKLNKSNETKNWDEYAAVGNVYYDTEYVSIICDPAPGLGADDRIGDSIQPFRMLFRGYVEVDANYTAGLQQVRVLIIQSKQGFVPASTVTTTTQGVLTRAGQTGAQLSHFIVENRDHFVVLSDKTYTVDLDSKAQIPINQSIKLSRPVRYQAGSTTAESGQIYILATSNIATATGNGPNFTWNSRILYKDS